MSFADNKTPPPVDGVDKSRIFSSLQKSRLKRWAEITSDEELSVSFLKSRSKAPVSGPTRTETSSFEPLSKQGSGCSNLPRLATGKEANCSLSAETVESSESMRKLSATLPANLATTETSLTSTASAAPSFSRSTQFPLGFVSLMNIVSSAATTNGNSFPSASSIENNHSSGTPANTDQHNCVEGVKGANNKVEPLRRIPASVILAHRAPSLRTVPRPAPSCIDAFDDSRSFSLHCVSRTWCTEQGYDCSATSSTVFRQKPKRRSNGSVDVSKTQFISSNFLSSMRDCSSDLPASNNTRTVPDVRGPLKEEPPVHLGLTSAGVQKGSLSFGLSQAVPATESPTILVPEKAAVNWRNRREKDARTRLLSFKMRTAPSPPFGFAEVDSKKPICRLDVRKNEEVEHGAINCSMPLKKTVILYRERQLSIEKSSQDYRHYIRRIPKECRTEKHPQTPRANTPISCGAFYAELHKWRYRIRHAVATSSF